MSRTYRNRQHRAAELEAIAARLVYDYSDGNTDYWSPIAAAEQCFRQGYAVPVRYALPGSDDIFFGDAYITSPQALASVQNHILRLTR